MTPRRLLALLLALAAAAAAPGGRAAQRPAAETAPAATPAPGEAAKPATATPATNTPPGTTPAPSTVPAPVVPLGPAGKKSRVPDLRTAAAQTPAPLSPRFQQVRDRIEELFRHRQETAPVLDPRSNPFRAAGAVVAPPTPRGTKPAPEAAPPGAGETDLQLLQQAAATLRVGGKIRINGLDHLSINQVAYKEGDVINARVKGQSVLIRVKNISAYSYTLSLNGTELSVKY